MSNLDTKACAAYLRKKLAKHKIKVKGGGGKPIDITPPTGQTGYQLWIQVNKSWFLDQVSMCLLRDVSSEELKEWRYIVQDEPDFSDEIYNAVSEWINSQ